MKVQRWKCEDESARMKVWGWKCKDESARMKVQGWKCGGENTGDEKSGDKKARGWNVRGWSVTQPLKKPQAYDVTKKKYKFIQVLVHWNPRFFGVFLNLQVVLIPHQTL